MMAGVNSGCLQGESGAILGGDIILEHCQLLYQHINIYSKCRR